MNNELPSLVALASYTESFVEVDALARRLFVELVA